MPVELRPGRPDDAPALARIYLASRAAAMPWLREPYTEAEIAAWLAGTLMAQHQVLVANDAGPAGYVGFGVDRRHGPMVLHLYVAPQRRRHGLGTCLLEAAGTALGPRLSLYCFAANTAARHFYEARGFRTVAEGDGSDNEEGAPDVLYRRDASEPPQTGDLS